MADTAEERARMWTFLDLESRLTVVAIALDDLADDAESSYERTRLSGKAEGVRLALAYVREHHRQGETPVVGGPPQGPEVGEGA